MADCDYDIVIVGGGVVGCATLFELTNKGYKCILIEKNEDILAEASSGNSGMLHTGFDAPSDSVELHCIKLCQARIFELINKWCLPFKSIGALMVAWNTAQEDKLEDILSSCITKNIQDVYKISRTDIYNKEPYLNTGANHGLWIPNESVTDPWLFPLLLCQHSILRGSKVQTNCAITKFTKLPYYCQLETSRGYIKCKAVVNCTGLYGDVIDRLADCQSFNIYPRKGQYAVYDKTANYLINSSILPVPSEKTKGIIIFKTVYDNVIVGPTAEDITDRAVPPYLDKNIHKNLRSVAKNTITNLSSFPCIGEYSGLRPASQYKDYQIRSYPDRNWISVGGIRSTGLSGCLGIGSYVYNQVSQSLDIQPTYGPISTIENIDWNIINNSSVQFGDSHTYPFVHPITLYGHRNISKL